MIKELEGLMYGKRLKELSMCRLAKHQPRVETIIVYKYLMNVNERGIDGPKGYD